MTEHNHNQKVLGNGVNYSGARPMKVYKDSNGSTWLCDKNVDPALGFAEQGCWNEGEMAFDRNF
jgi:hypothetical protein